MRLIWKKIDGGVVLWAERADGSFTAQRSGHGGFFALHDLMHYAVETVLGHRRAFWGLVEAGYDFETFSDKGDPRYRMLPREAVDVEHVVAALTRVAAEGAWKDAELLGLATADVNGELAAVGAGVPVLEAGQVREILAVFDGLAARWRAVEPGGEMVLEFPG